LYHWTDYIKGIDMYGAKPRLEVRGHRKVKSYCGAFVSFITFLLIVVFLLYKLSKDVVGLRSIFEMLGLEGGDESEIKMEFDLS
jgi:hypothetical protein